MAPPYSLDLRERVASAHLARPLRCAQHQGGPRSYESKY